MNNKTKQAIDAIKEFCENSMPQDHDVTIIVSPKKDKKGNASLSAFHSTAKTKKITKLMRRHATDLDDGNAYPLFCGCVGTISALAKEGRDSYASKGDHMTAKLINELIEDLSNMADRYSGIEFYGKEGQGIMAAQKKKADAARARRN